MALSAMKAAPPRNVVKTSKTMKAVKQGVKGTAMKAAPAPKAMKKTTTAKAMKDGMKVQAMKESKKGKAMKEGMKGGKAMKAKAVSKIARGSRAKSSVLSGRKEKTSGGLHKADLTKNSKGKVVSRKRSAYAKRVFAGSKLKAWTEACRKARKALGLKGFVAIGGKTAAGKALYAKIKATM